MSNKQQLSCYKPGQYLVGSFCKVRFLLLTGYPMTREICFILSKWFRITKVNVIQELISEIILFISCCNVKPLLPLLYGKATPMAKFMIKKMIYMPLMYTSCDKCVKKFNQHPVYYEPPPSKKKKEK